MGQILSTGWQPAHSDALVEYIKAGRTYANAALEINAQFGTNYSRNAVIGRANRLSLVAPLRTKQAPKKRVYVYKPRPKRPPSAEIVRALCEEIAPRGISLNELEPDDCRYPFGDGPFTFCGHRKILESSYCEAHSQLSHRTERRA